MEPHPIPQNVTSFQFRLIGDMTLKQFGYLAIGSAIAYLLFVFLSPIYPIVAWPLIIISAGAGAAFAFLPVNSRPLDLWVRAFLKAVYSPAKRVWKKNNKLFREDPLFNSRYTTYLTSLQSKTVPPAPVTPPAGPSAPTVPASLPTKEELGETVDLAKKAQDLQMKIIQTEKALSQIKTAAQKSSSPPIDYTQQVNTILASLQTLINQASIIKQQLHTVTDAPAPPRPQLIPPATPPPAPIVAKPEIKVVIPTKPKPTQVALTSFPNVINGIIQNSTGNYLDGVVVVIYDKQGLPVRALKSNKLGQFTGSTPLPNSTYRVEMEKEGFAFDVLQIELTGSILPPLQITAKGATN